MKPNRNMHRLSISLTEEQNKDVERLVEAGVYKDKAEAIREAVRQFIRKPPASRTIEKKRAEEQRAAEAAEQGSERGE